MTHIVISEDIEWQIDPLHVLNPLMSVQSDQVGIIRRSQVRLQELKPGPISPTFSLDPRSLHSVYSSTSDFITQAN